MISFDEPYLVPLKELFQNFPLPHGWEVTQNDDGTNVIYTNKAAEITSEEHPLSPVFSEVVTRLKEAEQDIKLQQCPHATGEQPCELSEYLKDVSRCFGRLQGRMDRFSLEKTSQISLNIDRVNELENLVKALRVKIDSTQNDTSTSKLNALSKQIVTLKLGLERSEKQRISAEEGLKHSEEEKNSMVASLAAARAALEKYNSDVDREVQKRVSQTDRLISLALTSTPGESSQTTLLKQALRTARDHLMEKEANGGLSRQPQPANIAEADYQERPITEHSEFLALKGEIDMVKSDLQLMREDKEDLMVQNQSNELLISNLRQQLVAKDVEISSLNGAIELHISQAEALKEKIADCSAALEEWQAYEERAEEKLSERDQTIVNLRESNAMISRTLKKISSGEKEEANARWKEVVDAQNDVLVAKNQVEDMRAALAATRKDMDRLKDEIKKKTEENDNLRTLLRQQGAASELASSILKREISTLETNLTERTRSYRKLTQTSSAQLSSLRSRASDLEDLLFKESSRANTFFELFTNTKEKLDAFIESNKVEELEKNIARLEAELRKAHKMNEVS